LACRTRRWKEKGRPRRYAQIGLESNRAIQAAQLALGNLRNDDYQFKIVKKHFRKITRYTLAVMMLSAADTKAGTQEQLTAYRQQIDSLDQRIVELIQQRARAVEEVGNIKRAAHLPVTVPSRERQVIEKAQELAKRGPLPAEAVGRIFQKLVEEMRNWEAKLNAAAPQSSSQPAAANRDVRWPAATNRDAR
jgi:chorismate mutase/prephenate dehydratase